MVALRHDARVASAVIGLLGNLSCSNLSFKKLVFEHDVPREVLIAMEEHARDVGVQALGVWALLNFAGVSQKRARELYELGGKDRIFAAMSEHALNDTIRLYGGALMRRLELVQELTVSAANMEEEEEIRVEKSFGDGDDGDGSASGSGASEDSELRKKIEALAKQSGEGDPHGGAHGWFQLGHWVNITRPKDIQIWIWTYLKHMVGEHLKVYQTYRYIFHVWDIYIYMLPPPQDPPFFGWLLENLQTLQIWGLRIQDSGKCS
eukprot:Skav231814  [mRNA]  locus=scaffold692:405581:406728:- [translate_table: standard]